MPRIAQVEIDNFRCFSKLRIEGLSRVNLFVGANNSGKTALLEAIEAVVSDDSPFVLYRASLERGEWRVRPGQGGAAEGVQLDVRHWFHGHQLEQGVRFTIRATGDRERTVSRAVERLPVEARSPLLLADLMLTLERAGKHVRVPPLPIIADGGFLGAGAPSTFAGFGIRLRPPVGFVTTGRRVPADLATLWAGVVLTPGEASTIAALRLVEPALDRIAISGGDDAIAQILLRGADRPVPLGTLGEGVSRMLAMALHLATARGGFLLVDEIENGLHWSVMPKLWHFLVSTARDLDVQVFATTHSKDCLEGIAELHREHPTLAEDVCVHRLEAARETTVRFDAGRIAEYVALELETR